MTTNNPESGGIETSLNRIPFTPEDEKTIDTASLWMKIAGIISIVAGVISIIFVFIDFDGGQTLGGVISIIMGIWLFSAGDYFHKVATTDVADQKYLAMGFSRLRNVFLLKSVLIIIMLGIMAAVFVLFFLVSL